MWALSLDPVRPTAETAAECMAAVEGAGTEPGYPLGMKPLVVIRTNNDSPAYRKLQARLVALSRDSKQVIAERSTHMVIVDQPEVIVAAIREVLRRSAIVTCFGSDGAAG